MEGGLAMLFADEEGGQGLLLVGELLEDDLHGLAVGGHVVGLAGEDVHACFAQLVDLSGGHFGLSGDGSGHQQLLGHQCGHLFLLGGLRAAFGYGYDGFRGAIVGIDGAEQAVIGQVDEGGGGFGFELDDVGIGLVGHAFVLQVDFTQFVIHMVGHDGILDAEILFGILVVRPGLAGHLGDFGRYDQRCFGEGVGDAVAVAFHRYFLLHPRLRKGRRGHAEQEADRPDAVFHIRLQFMLPAFINAKRCANLSLFFTGTTFLYFRAP